MKEKSCGAVIYYQHDDVRVYLLIQHVNGGHWAFAKGHVENEETEVETALREIKEETQLEVILDANFRSEVTYSPKPGVVKDVIYFIAESKSLNVMNQQEEVTQIMWLPLEEALQRLTYESDRQVLTDASAYLDSLERNE